MSNIRLSDFEFLRMWPRSAMKIKKGSRLRIKEDVEALGRPGVYVLYKGEEPYYVGKATRLMSRLHDHSNKVTDGRYAHWDYFSAFVLAESVTDSKQKLAELESILIAAMPRASNKSTPRFKLVKLPKQLRKE